MSDPVPTDADNTAVTPPAGPGGAAPVSPARNEALWIVLFIVFIDLLGFGIILPQLPFFGKRYQASNVQVVLIFSLYSLCQFLAAPVLGLFSDKFGRRPVLVFSQLGSALGYLLLGIVTQFNFTSVAVGLGLVYLARIIDGISGGNISTAQAYISDVTTPQTRAKGMGMLGAAFGVGFSMGPALAGVIGNDTNRAAWPAYLAAIFSFTAMLLSAFRLPESHSRAPVNEEAWLHPSRFVPILKKPVLANLMAVGFLAMVAFTMLEATIALFLNNKFTYGARHTAFGTRQVGWYFAYIGILIMYVQGRLMGQMVRRFGEWRVTIAGAALVVIAMVLYVLTSYFPVLALLAVAGAFNAFGRSLHSPPISSLLSKLTNRSEQGTVFGLFQGLMSVGRSIGPVVAGFLFAYLNHTGQFIAAAIIMAIVTMQLIRVKKLERSLVSG